VTFYGAFEAQLIALGCSETADGRQRWTVRLLAKKAVELHLAQSVLHVTGQRILEKTNLSLTSGNSGKSRRRGAPRSQPIWKMSLRSIICLLRCRHPQVCKGETRKQFIGEVHEAIACAPGRPKRIEAPYVGNGVVQILLQLEQLTGECHVEATEHRTRQDWAWWIKGMFDERYPNAMRVRLILDNLNTHGLASLYEPFEPQETRRWQNVPRNPLHAQARERPQHVGDRAKRFEETVP